MDTDLSALRRQLLQLQELHASGVLGDDSYRQSRQALEQRIVEAVLSGAVETPRPVAGSSSPATAAPTPAASAAAGATASVAGESGAAAKPALSGRLLVGLGAGVVVLAAAGYWLTGSPRAVSEDTAGAGTEAAAGAASAPHPMGTDQIAGMIGKLEQRLKDAPQDAEGWSMLARSYVVLGRHADAVPTYKNALALRPDDASLIADYADALAVVNGRQLTGESLKLVDRALKLDPDNLKALALAGTAAFDRKDYAGAVKHWERIVVVAPAGSSFLQQVQSNIAEARDLGKLPPAVALAASAPPAAGATPAPAAASSGATVSGTVTLAAALRAKADPTDTVFVFARAAEGPRMPLAILRKQVKDLPFDFRLDDSTAMSPAMRLSTQKRVVIGARVSKSGNAVPQPGDLSVQSPTVDVGASGLKLEISQVVGN